MAITNADLRFFAAERMTDNSDGGGRMSATEIVSGVENSVFDDVSDVDRSTGDLSIRKVYAAVTSNDTDKYLDSSVGLFKAPADPATTVMAFSTGDFYDERSEIANQVEQFRAKSIDTGLRLIGTHYVNQRIVYGYLLNPLSYDIGVRFYDQVIALSEGNNEQFVRVMRVRQNQATYIYMNGSTQATFIVTEVTLDITTGLSYQFSGAEQNPSGAYVPPTIVTMTQVVPPIVFQGIYPLTVQATTGATTLTVADTKVSIVPVEYQDLGETQASYNSGMLTAVLDAPDGFSVTLPAAPSSVSRIAYLYGDEWIESGEPNAASYFPGSGTISFPLRPDIGSKVYVEWPYTQSNLTEVLYATPGTVIDVVSASAQNSQNQGRLLFNAWVDAGEQTKLVGIDDGSGNITGQLTGTVNYTTGDVSLSADGVYTGGILSESVLIYLYTPFIDPVLLVAAPIIPSMITISANKTADHALIIGTDDGLGVITGTGVSGTVDYITGLISLTYTDAMIDRSIVASYHLGGIFPQSADILGIDSVRLPKNGRVSVYADNQLVLIHHTATVSENSLSPTQVIDCGRVRLYRATVEDVNGVRLSPEYFTVDRELGTVTMKPTLDLTGLTAPYTISHTIGDVCRINRVSAGNNQLILARPVSHTFPSDESMVSSLLYIGTLQARITKLFAQSTWTSVWQDSLIGSEPLAQFNDVQHPIQLTNAGAYPDRILVKFTSSTDYQVIGENLGLIGIGDTTHDCSPLNSLTGVPYFTIPYLGWGLGWATGNCLRFNVISAAYPIDLIRAIQPSDPSGLDSDSVELLLIGNVDA